MRQLETLFYSSPQPSSFTLEDCGPAIRADCTARPCTDKDRDAGDDIKLYVGYVVRPMTDSVCMTALTLFHPICATILCRSA